MQVIIHYNEIGLKGGNRGFFEDKLIENIKKALNKNNINYSQVKKQPGSFLVVFDKEFDREVVKNVFKKIFGISYFVFATKTSQDVDELKGFIWKIVKKKSFKTFRITTKRTNKTIPLGSQDYNMTLGEFIFNKGYKVDLNNPDLNICVELINNDAFVYFEKHKGPGGMPVGSAGRGLVLISGGFDSPVAAWYMMKRGLKVDYIHFHSMPYTSEASLDKVKRIIKVLEEWGGGSCIKNIAFADFQKQVLVSGVTEKLRVVIYRRQMLRIAEEYAKKNKYKCLITGDCLAQVASQTIENMSVIGQVAEILIIRPLVGMDKLEIIDKARVIGTHEISKLPHDDCCTRFIPKHPETRARLESVLEAEKKLFK